MYFQNPYQHGGCGNFKIVNDTRHLTNTVLWIIVKWDTMQKKYTTKHKYVFDYATQICNPFNTI
jgi:hypothetical protein